MVGNIWIYNILDRGKFLRSIFSENEFISWKSYNLFQDFSLIFFETVVFFQDYKYLLKFIFFATNGSNCSQKSHMCLECFQEVFKIHVHVHIYNTAKNPFLNVYDPYSVCGMYS